MSNRCSRIAWCAVSVEFVPDHVVSTTVVFDDLRLAYVPVPKAATTSILGALSELAGVRPEDRACSRKLEVTRALTVHDGSVWSSRHRLKGRDQDELDWILQSDEWFRFTVVREPARRLWSAWVSKVLVRNPRFALMYGDDLFPAPPSSSRDVVESFRRFVLALPDRPEWSDSHWSSQADLLGVPAVPFAHVGRVEQLDRTAAAVAAHLRSRGARLPPWRLGNESYLPFSFALFDRPATLACRELTARDRDVFGYEPCPYVDGGPDDRWHATVDASVPVIRALIEQNERFLDLWRMLPEREDRARATAPLRQRVRFVRATASARLPAPRSRRARIGTRVAVAAAALALLFVLLPEMLGDRPYDPRPSSWAARIEDDL
jgi:Sulfotransferase family